MGDITGATRHGVIMRPPVPRQVKVYVTGPDGCSASGTEQAGNTFGQYLWEDAGQADAQQIPATPLPFIFYVRYSISEFRTSYTDGIGPKTLPITFTLSGGGGCSGSADFTLTTVMSNGAPLPAIVYRTPGGAVPSICTGGTGLRDNSNCNYGASDGQDSSSMLMLKNLGDTGTDAAWGHTLKKITSGPVSLPGSASGWSFVAYSATTAWARDSNYIFTETTGGYRTGWSGFLRLTDMVEPRDGNGVFYGSNYMIPSTIYDGVVQHIGGHTIQKRVINFSTGADVLVENYELNTAPLFITSMWHGGTSDMTADGWWGFFEQTGANQRGCAVDMNGINSSNYLNHIYCAPLKDVFGPDAPDYDLDTMHVSGLDRRTNQRYVVAFNQRRSRWGVYTVNLAAHRLDAYMTPEAPSEGTDVCAPGTDSFGGFQRQNGDGVLQTGECGMHVGHSDFGEFDGKQFWVGTLDFAYYNERWMIAIDLAAGKDMTLPVEFGGGMYMLNKMGSTGTGNENHESCAPKAGICSWAFYKCCGNRAATVIASITAANPAVITTSGGHGWGNGARTLVTGGFSQTSYRNCAMGKFAATVTDATHITLNGANCVGAGGYSGNDGLVGDIAPSTYPYYGGEAHIADLHHIVRAINTREYRFGGNVGESRFTSGYYSYPEASLSQDGTKLAFHSTIGLPENESWVADTGWTAASAIRPVIQPTHNGATASVSLPVAKACTWTVMVDAATTIETKSTPSATVHHVILTGESAATNYLLRATCGVYSATLPFRTAATPTGTASITPAMLGVAGAADIVFDYGTTTGLGTTSPASACAAGAQCRASATLAKGIWYIQPRVRNGSGVAVATGVLTEIRN